MKKWKKGLYNVCEYSKLGVKIWASFKNIIKAIIEKLICYVMFWDLFIYVMILVSL